MVKNIRSSELLDQLRGHRQSEAAITRRTAARILEEFQRGQVEAGQFAARLEISEHTVKNHLKNILSTLHLRSRREAADGLARGWVHPGEPAP